MALERVDYREYKEKSDKEIIRRLLGAFTNTARLQETNALAKSKDFLHFYLSFISYGSKDRRFQPITLFGVSDVIGVELTDEIDESYPPIFFVPVSEFLSNTATDRSDLHDQHVVLVIDSSRLEMLASLLDVSIDTYIDVPLEELINFDELMAVENPCETEMEVDENLGLFAEAMSHREALALMEREERAAQITAMIFDAFDVTRSNLVKHGLEHIQPEFRQLDSGILITFSEFRSPTPVQIPMRQVLSLDDEVDPQDQPVMGIFVPHELGVSSATFEEVYQYLPPVPLLDLAKELDNPSYTQIAIATPEQVEVWSRYGFFGELASQRSAEVQMSEVLSFLEQAGVAHIADIDCATHHYGQDFIFWNPDTKSDVLTPLKKIHFKTLGAKGKTEVVDNTVGIVLVEEGLTVTEKKAIAKRVREQIRPHFPGIDAARNRINILAVDQEVLRHWQNHLDCNQPFWEEAEPQSLDNQEETEIIASPEERKKGRVKEIKLHYFEIDAPAIGAKPAHIEICYENGDKELILLDFGAQYEQFAWGDDFTRPSKAKGIKPFLKHIPEVPGMIRLELIKTTAKKLAYPFFTNEEYDFWVMELFSRMEEEDFIQFINGIDRDILDYLSPQWEQMRRLKIERKKTKIIGAFFSHPHDDHVGWAGLLSSTYPRIFSQESLPWYLYYYKTSGSNYLKKESLLRRDQNNQIIAPPTLRPEPFQEIILGAGRVKITLVPMDHSLANNMLVVKIVEKTDTGEEEKLHTIAYTGDFRFEDTGTSEQSLARMTGQLGDEPMEIDTVMVDTTRTRKEDSSRSSTEVTKEMVQASITKEIKEAKGVAVVQMAVNNLRDAYYTYLAALESGRKIVLSPQMATFFALQEERDVQLTGGDSQVKRRYPRIRLSQSYIFDGDKESYTALQKATMSRYGHVVTAADINKHKNDYVLLLTPQPTLEQQLTHVDINKDDVLIRSHYYPYGKMDQRDLRKNQAFADKTGARWVSDFLILNNHVIVVDTPSLHASGHANLEQLKHFVQQLAINCHAAHWVNIHGQARTFAANYIEKAVKEVRPDLDARALYRMDKFGNVIELYENELVPEYTPEFEPIEDAVA